MLPLDRLRDYLLPKTLEHAVANSTFYNSQLGDAWHDVTTVSALPRLPLLTKALAVQHQQAMRCGPAVSDIGATSSGTTRVGREFLRIQHCPEELDALDEYLTMVRNSTATAHAQSVGGDAREDLVLHVVAPHHGLPPPPPPGTLRLAWFGEASICEMIMDALLRAHEGRRITTMRLSISALKQLTVYAQQRDVDFADVAVTRIGTNSAHVTERWRRLVETIWGARLFDNYSLSELVTPATECEACGWYHFGVPPLIAEVLDPVTATPMVGGVGQLVLTGLYPYVQRQPLIRYATGDLVEVGPTCDLAGDLSLRFKGRLHQTLRHEVDGASRWLLFPTNLEEVADAQPLVARHRVPLELVGDILPGLVGQPMARADLHSVGDHLTVSVALGVTYPPALFGAQSARLVAEVRDGLLRRHPDLAADCATGKVTLKIELVPPGETRDWFVKYSQ